MSNEPKTTVEYQQNGKNLMIIVHEKGKQTVTIVANTIPETAQSHIRKLEKDESK